MERKNENNRKIDQKKTMQVVIDAGLHNLLKIRAATEKTTIKALMEECLAEFLAVDKKRK